MSTSFAEFLESRQVPIQDLPSLVLPVKEFIVVKACPQAWRAYDLYLVRDQKVTFYVGKSELAFFRLWQHILDGYKGRSTVGRFILCNWRASMNFTIELISSRSTAYTDLHNDRSEIERALIGKHAPCFNVVSNPTPTPLPGQYRPTTLPIEHARHLGRVIREAGYVLKAEQRYGWLAEMGDERGGLEQLPPFEAGEDRP